MPGFNEPDALAIIGRLNHTTFVDSNIDRPQKRHPMTNTTSISMSAPKMLALSYGKVHAQAFRPPKTSSMQIQQET